jgi:hypothetical protein
MPPLSLATTRPRIVYCRHVLFGGGGEGLEPWFFFFGTENVPLVAIDQPSL